MQNELFKFNGQFKELEDNVLNTIPISSLDFDPYPLIKNKSNLHKLADLYLEKYESEYNHFGFVSFSDCKNQRQKTIFAIGSYIKRFTLAPIYIVTDHLESSYFYSYAHEMKRFSKDCSGVTMSAQEYCGINFISLERINSLLEEKNYRSLKSFWKTLFCEDAIVLWDLPDIYYLEKEGCKYIPIIESLDFVTPVFMDKLSKESQVTSLIKYFNNFNKKFMGIVFKNATVF